MAQADGTIYINTAIETDGMKSGGKEVEAAARRMAKSVSGIGESARLALQKQTDSFVRQNQMYAQQERKVESLKAKLEEMRGQKVATDEFKAIGKQIDADKAKLNSLIKKQEDFVAAGKNTNSAVYGQRQRDIEELKNSIESAKREQEELLQSGNAYKPVDTSAVEEKLISEQQRLAESGNRLGTSYEQLKQKVVDYGGVINECGGYLGILQTIFLGLKRAIEVTGIALLHFPIAVIRIVSGLVQKLGSFAKSAALHLMSLVKKSIINGFKKMASAAGKAMLSLSGINSQAKKSKNTFGKSLKTILKYTLGIRSMYILLNKIRTGIKEGFSNLAQYSGETNQSISSLMSALTQLKNSLATAFAPILNVVAPILTTFINLISKAVTYVGMLFAALTGKKTFDKAVGVQKNYADSLGKTASNAKDAEKALEGYLSPIDEINKMEKPDAGDIGGGAGGAGGDSGVGGMFKTVPIEDSIIKMVQKIKDLIKNEDWEGLGAYIASGINAGLQKLYDAINWDNVGPKITYFVNAFTRTFNSLVDNIDWDLMGRVLGAGINTVVNTLNLLIEGIDWINLGKKISVGLRGMLDEVNWKNFGKAIGNYFMIGWRVFDGFVTDMWRKDNAGLTGWSQLGISFGDALNGIVQKIDLGKIGSSLGKAITGIFQSAIDSSKTFDWKALGLNVANGINNFLKNFDAKTVAEGTSEITKGILDSLIEAVETVDWNLLGKKISDFLANIDWAGIAERLFELLGAALGGLAAFLGGLISGAVESAKEYFSGKIEEMGGDIGGGILFGIIDGLANIGTWIKEHIFQPFINGFKEAFGIHSPSTVMQEQGVFLMEGLYNGIKSKIEKVISNFEEIKRKILNKWEEVRTKSLEKWGEIKKSISAKWEEIKGDSYKKFNAIKETILKAWNNTKKSTQNIWTGIGTIIKGVVNSIIATLNKMISGVVNAFNSVIDAVNKMFSFEPPDWLASVGVKGWSPNIQKIEAPQIPYLATGAVIPPNAPFMAMLGDQRHGTNLEAPEALIRRIVREESGGSGKGGQYRFTAQINRRTLFDEMISEAKLIRDQNGRNPFELA